MQNVEGVVGLLGCGPIVLDRVARFRPTGTAEGFFSFFEHAGTEGLFCFLK